MGGDEPLGDDPAEEGEDGANLEVAHEVQVHANETGDVDDDEGEEDEEDDDYEEDEEAEEDKRDPEWDQMVEDAANRGKKVIFEVRLQARHVGDFSPNETKSNNAYLFL